MTADSIAAYKGERRRLTHARVADTAGAEVELIPAGGAGILRDLVFLSVANNSANDVEVDIRDALAGTIRLTISAPADVTVVVPFPKPLPQAVAAAAWTMDVSAATSTIFVTAMTIDVE